METACAIGFHNIPNELFLSILGLIPSTIDIFALSSTCRRSHYTCLSYLFSRNGFDPFGDEISILPGIDDFESAEVILEALARSLLVNGASLKRLNCRLTSNHKTYLLMTREARLLLQYISKLSHVGMVSLQMTVPSSSGWKAVVLDLLDLLSLKSCTEVELNCTNIFGPQTRPKSMPSPSLLKSAVKFLHTYFPTISRILDKPKPVQATSRTSLERCHLQRIPRFLQPKYVQLLNTSSNLTQLSVEEVYDTVGWTACLEEIRLPNLSSLSVTHCAVPLITMAYFFARHPSLRSLEFHHNTLFPTPPPRLKGAVLRNVKELVSSPDCVSLYFPSPRALPHLRSIRILAGVAPLGFTYMEGAFQKIAECRQDISLTLDFTSYAPMLNAWLQHGTRHSGTNPVIGPPEALSRCVKDLHIDSLDKPFSDLNLSLFPGWLGLFPEIRDITFAKRCFLDPSSITIFSGEDGFVSSVGKACISLKTFRLSGKGDEWHYVYPGRS